QVCVSGVVHGQRYALGFRAGLPAASGEALAKTVEIAQYVRDRGPRVAFAAGTYVLPRGAAPALPVTTVNAPRLDLTLARVADANILRTMQEGSFAAPLESWQIDRFAAEIGEVIWRGTAETDGALNRDTTTRLPLDDLGQALAPGLYTLTASVTGAETWRVPPATQWFVITDIGLGTLSGSDGLHVFARSLGSAEGLAGVRLTLVSAGNRELAQAVTDESGHAAFAPGLLRGEGAGAPGLVRAESAAGDDMAFLSLTGPEFDLSDRGVAGRAVPGPVDVFATTERGAWRAGETVHVTALARDGDGRAVDGVPLSLRLIRPDGVEHIRLVMDDAGDGGHLAAVPLPDGAPRGTWRAEIHADPDAAPLASLRLLVEDFLPERIDVALDLPEGPADPAAPLPLGVQADYLFGLPAAGLAVTGEMRLQAVRTLDAFPGYLFGPEGGDGALAFATLPAGLVTGPDGALRVAAPLPAPAPDGAGARPLRLDLTVQVADTSARPVERQASRPLAPAEPVVGLRPLFSEVVPDGMPARFEVLAVGQGAAPVPARLRWQLDRIETHYQWYELYGDWRWEPVTLRTRVAAGELAVDGSGPTALSVPLDPGQHELRVERVDGAYAAASHRFWAGWFAPAEAPETPDALPVALDRAAYAPGDVARLRITPREGGRVLVAVMADRLIDWREVAVAAGETTVELPVTAEWGAGAYVWATWFRPMAEPGATPTRGPGRAMGIAHAAVAPGDRALAAA
ncbi:MAG: alpha-2-macroglobulin family protein, partial [Rhodobacteraceae bacterium]|nr:alpha-2-macroglobulin family protein [Paracoccaceae bacterium]